MAWSDRYVVHHVVRVGLVVDYVLFLLIVCSLSNIMDSIASFSVFVL